MPYPFLGGALFGFDISSMSAIISTEPYKCQFNRAVRLQAINSKKKTNADHQLHSLISMRRDAAMAPPTPSKVASLPPCPEAPGLVLSSLAS